MDKVADVAEIAVRLIRTDTQNPPGNERAIQSVVREILGAPADAEIGIEPEPGRRSMLIRLAEAPGPRMVWNAHLDVVATPAERWSYRPDGEILGDRLYGRGSADMKGGLACLLAAVRRVSSSPAGLRGTLDLHLVADEERGSRVGAAALAAAGLLGQHDICFVPEPTNLAISYAERGTAWLTVEVRAREPRARSWADSTVAALTAVARALASDPWGRRHPLMDPLPAHVGAMHVGDLPNRAAAEGVLRFDVRLQPGDTAAEIVEGTRTSVERALGAIRAPFDHWITVDKFDPATETKPGTTLAAGFEDTIETVTGRRADRIAMDGPTDARYYRRWGVPAVVFGPGNPALAHRPDEYVELGALAVATAVYERHLGACGEAAVR